MNNFNPMLDYQRNQLMAQQAMIQNQLNQINHMNPANQPQFNPYPQNNQPQFFVRQVGNVDEARSFPVDPNTIYFFPDTGTGKIYMKRLNTDNGKSEFFIYNLQENSETEKPSDPMEQINLRLTNIENIIGGIANDKSISSHAGNEKSNGNIAETNVGKVQKSKPSDVSAGSANDTREK